MKDSFQVLKLDCLFVNTKKRHRVHEKSGRSGQWPREQLPLKTWFLAWGGHSRSQPGHTVSSCQKLTRRCHIRALCAPKPIRPGYENPLGTFGNSSHIRTSKATRTATTRFSSARCVVALAWGLLRFAALRCTQHQKAESPTHGRASIRWWAGQFGVGGIGFHPYWRYGL